MDAWRSVVLVEGESDRVAVETLAARRGRDLGAEGVAVVATGGATTMGRFLRVLGPPGLGLPLVGLCDAREAGHVRRALEAAGLSDPRGRAGMAALGFHVCVADLEDELIRALGAARVERVIEAAGELRSLRILRSQPAQRGRSREAVLWRFMGTRGGRKARYARLLVEALDLAHVPPPLDAVLAASARGAPASG